MSYSRTTWSDGSTALSAEHMNNIEDGINEALEGVAAIYTSQSLFDAIYPVGSIYMSVNNANPGTLFGGTWVAWGSGRVPVGVDSADTLFDTVEEEGGSKDAIVPQHNHTATFAGSPVGTHQHSVSGNTGSAGSHTHGTNSNSFPYFVLSDYKVTNEAFSSLSGSGYRTPRVDATMDAQFSYGSATSSAGSHTHSVSITSGAAGSHTPSGTVTVASKGVSATNANLQPYITCYMWKRTA